MMAAPITFEALRGSNLNNSPSVHVMHVCMLNASAVSDSL